MSEAVRAQAREKVLLNITERLADSGHFQALAVLHGMSDDELTIMVALERRPWELRVRHVQLTLVREVA